MFRIIVPLLCYILVAESIKVPTSWDDFEKNEPIRSSSQKLGSLEIPTRPIYPGKGVWAKPGYKHRPFVREDFLTTYPPLEEDNYKKIRNNLNPSKIRKSKKQDKIPESSNINEDFIPRRLYSQVRKSEEESHHPYDEDEPRLREVIKDSRIHTVYTEEGYEDGEYDHGDHEKKAENQESFQHEDNNHDGSTNFGKRIKFTPKQKKSTNLKKFPAQKIDDKTGFLIMADINKHIKRNKRSIKYPYYNNTEVSKNSPLRYALDLGKIPEKKEGEFVIYNKNDCEEPPADINPIPERVQKGEAKNEDEKDVELPRLKNLGDKIECLKNKYFGEEPLDSPIFGEELINSRQGKNLEKNSTSEDLPEASELRMRRRRRRPIKRQNSYGIKYKPNLPINVYTTTPYPNSYTISEVFYKDDIKPNEQLNVFADVINNIKNSTRDKFIGNSDIIQSNFIQKSTIPPRKIKPARFHRTPGLQEHSPTYIRKKSHNKKFIPHCPGKFCFEHKKFTPINLAASEQNFITQPPEDFQPSITKNSYQQHVEPPTSDYSTIDLPMNKFLVPGMKPPSPLEKPYIYSDFQITPANFTAQKRVFRIRRSAARLNYAEIRRPKPEKQEDDEEEDQPHRVYYDTKSDMVVYNTKSRTTTETPTFVEVEYDEIEETTKAPVKTTTQRPHKTVFHKDVLDKKNGLTLVDFLEKLRADPKYISIPDPLPTTTTVAPEKTAPPEFLAFLQNLHHNPDYVKYEDKDEKAIKIIKTTTESAEEVAEEVIEDVKIQNSPGGQFRPDYEDVEIKSFSPRTSIDYSKYKTIERSTIKNKINVDDDESDEVLIKRDQILEETTVPSTSTSTTTTTTKRSIKIRSRKRPQTTTPKTTTPVLTRRTTRSTVDDSISTTTHRSSVSRVYPRRSPRPKIRVRPTTPSIEVEANTEEVQRKLRKIHEVIPVNHKPSYTPIQDRIDTETHFDYKKPRLITPDILSYNKTVNNDQPGRISPRSYDVEVFKNYDRKQKHGGNYRRKGDKYNFIKNNHEIIEEPSTENVSKSRETLELEEVSQEKSRESLEETANSSLSTEIDSLESLESEEGGKSTTEKSKDYEFDDEVKILFNPGSKGKKVVIIKDPNRRRYFYAPI